MPVPLMRFRNNDLAAHAVYRYIRENQPSVQHLTLRPIVKQAAADPQHPAHARLQKLLADDRRDFPPVESYRANKRVGRNAPCPCGSGKKYKHCCGRR